MSQDREEEEEQIKEQFTWTRLTGHENDHIIYITIFLAIAVLIIWLLVIKFTESSTDSPELPPINLIGQMNSAEKEISPSSISDVNF